MASTSVMDAMSELFNPVERAAWLGFLRSHSALLRRLDADLRRAHGISISAYEALIVLGVSELGSLQMSELAERTLLTQSGISRLVTRLERDGLVKRESDPTDRRASRIALTEAGDTLMHLGLCTHFAGVRNRFFDRFSEAELLQLSVYFDRLTTDAKDEDSDRAASRDRC